MNRKRVSDLITKNDINNWGDKTTVIIKAGTGAGKSYFIKNTLYESAKLEGKKILFLIHRTDCINQFQEEIEKDNKTDIINIITYQFLENNLKESKNLDLSNYAYIVCDEFHYFMSDAAYNKTTDMSLNLILDQKEQVKIFMSATGDDVTRYLKYKKKIDIKEYEIKSTYEHIDSLTFFYKDDTMCDFIEECIENDGKAIFFIESAKKAYELYSKYKKHCLFNCSKHNKEYIKHVDKEKISKMFKEQKFDENILITTTCMDAGVNIIDLDLHHIVCDVEDIDVLIQCIGRKRIQNDDKVNIYIKAISNRQLGGIETQLKLKINKADFLKSHTVAEYIKKYPRANDYYNIIYDDVVENSENKNVCTKKINELMYYKCKIDIAAIEIMKTMGDFGYNKYISFIFGIENYRIIEEEKRCNLLENYLDSIVGKKLFKDDQKELIEKIDVKVNGKLQKTYNKLNEGLKMIDVPYIIIPKKSGSIRYWIIEKYEK